ncbi:MAG: hypothetical protein IH987_06270 [Planctomycetes bacterium]|nr:hypothetical protein [Planctomycetota bacterium]
MFEPGVSTLPDDGGTATEPAANRQPKPEKTWANQPDFSQCKQEDESDCKRFLRGLGADEVIKTEQGVALQFYDKLSQRIRHRG